VTKDESAEVVRRLTEAFVAGDGETVLSLFAHAIEIREAPSLPWGGVHRGREGFAALQATMARWWETSHPALQVSDAGDVVLLRERMTITGRATGRSMELEVVDVITVRDGRITEIDVYYKDVHAVLDVLGA
jgi:ketosteroid isomerase-like protein